MNNFTRETYSTVQPPGDWASFPQKFLRYIAQIINHGLLYKKRQQPRFRLLVRNVGSGDFGASFPFFLSSAIINRRQGVSGSELRGETFYRGCSGVSGPSLIDGNLTSVPRFKSIS
jgi:hypothetical protein